MEKAIDWLHTLLGFRMLVKHIAVCPTGPKFYLLLRVANAIVCCVKKLT